MRQPLPLLGVIAVVTGAITPAWAIIALVTGGLEAAFWVPVIVLFYLPYNLVFLALFIVAVLCGFFALRHPGSDRVLGRIGLILAGIQLVAAVAYVVWALGDGLLGG